MKYALVLISLLVMGCDNIVLPPVEGRHDPYDAKQVHFQNDELRRDTATAQPTATRDQSGLLHVTVPIRNATDITLYVDYRVTWFDDNRQVIDQTSWFNKALEARTPDQITVNSTSSKAADFQVDFRYSR